MTSLDRDLEILRPSLDGELELPTHRGLFDGPSEGVEIRHGLPVDRRDPVSHLQSGLCGGATRRDSGHHHPGRSSSRISEIETGGADHHSEITSPDPAEFRQVIQDSPSKVRGDHLSKSIKAGWAFPGVEDAHDPALEVDQRSTGVGRVDHGIGPDGMLFAGSERATDPPTDDSGRDRLIVSALSADGEHPIAELERPGIAPFGLLETGCARIDDHHREIGAGIGDHTVRRRLATVLKSDDDP